MPVTFDRFLRVVSRGKYSSTDLFKVRETKTVESIDSVDQSLKRLRALKVNQLADFEEELNRHRDRLTKAQALASGAPTMEQLRQACDMLEPVKQLCRDTEDRAKKLVSRMESVSSVERLFNPPPSKGEEEAKPMPHLDPLRFFTAELVAIDEELEELPATGGGLVEQMAALDARRKNLILLFEKTVEKIKEQRGKPQAIEDLRETAEEASHKLAKRKKLLQTLLNSHPTSEKQLFKSKVMAVDAAVDVIDKAIASKQGDPVALLALNKVKVALAKRKDVMQQRDGTIAISDPGMVLGAKDPSSGAKEEITGVLGTGTIDDLPLTSPKIREEDMMELALKDAYTKAGLDPEEVEHLYESAQIKTLNKQKWGPIKKKVELSYNGKKVEVESGIIPVSNLGNKYEELLGEGGVCSHDAKAYQTATNLAVSELKDKQGNVLFSALRHGINCAYGITPDELKHLSDSELTQMVKDLLPKDKWENDPKTRQPDLALTVAKVRDKLTSTFKGDYVDKMRETANYNRAEDVATAALLKNSGKLAKALKGEVVEININSMSLVTPDSYRGGEADEKNMLKEQMAAWEKLSADPQPKTIMVKNAQGELVPVKVQIDVTAFNFGVNAGAMNWYGAAPGVSGWNTSDGYNAKAMDKLLGSASQRKSSPNKLGGRVGAWLTRTRKELLEAEEAADDLGLGGMSKDNLKALNKRLEVVEKLAKQIAAIWDAGAHKSAGHEPYKIVSRLAVLTHMMDEDAAFNCKSGKDRTGQLDVEAKLLATQIATTGDVPEPNLEPDDNAQKNRFIMGVQGGNHEMQQLNTGHMGFKLKGVKPLDKSYGDKENVGAFRGTSDFTKT